MAVMMPFNGMVPDRPDIAIATSGNKAEMLAVALAGLLLRG